MRWEVRTMRFGTSFFNGTVWKKTFLRFWPIWAANLVFWVLLLPAQGLTALREQAEHGGSQFLSFAASVGGLGGDMALVFAVIFGLLAAMAVCSHLYSSRSANFMGALPIRREGLFVSHYTAGLSMLLLPNLAVFLLMALIEVLGGAVEWPPLMFWLASLSGMEFFFYSFAVCIGMFTGHLLALPVFYGVFNFLAAGVLFLWEMTMQEFYYGYAGNERLSVWAEWLTPTIHLEQQVECYSNWGIAASGAGVNYSEEYIVSYDISGLGTVGVYALAGLVFTVCALLLYRRRQMETAGDVVAVRAMRPVFQYGVAICSGLCFGTVTVRITGLGTAGMMVAMVVWAIVGYFVARMLLDKTVRVLRRWKGAVAVTAVFAALFLVVGFDLTGFETRVPDPAQVASVRISGLRSEPGDDGSYWYGVVAEDPEEIALVTQLHQAVVAHQGESWDDDDCRQDVDLVYTMKDGSVMTRSYGWVVCHREDSGQPGTVAYGVEQLLADRDLVWQTYGLDEAQAILDNGGQIANAYYSIDGDVGEWPDTSTQEVVSDDETAARPSQEIAPIDMPTTEASSTPDDGEDAAQTAWDFYGNDAQALWDAVLQDFQEGNIGVRDLWGGWTDWPARTVTFYMMSRDYWRDDGEMLVQTQDRVTVTIVVPGTAVRTLAALEELGAALAWEGAES